MSHCTCVPGPQVLLHIFRQLLSAPTLTPDVCTYIKLVCKTFWSVTYLGVPDLLLVSHYALWDTAAALSGAARQCHHLANSSGHVRASCHERHIKACLAAWSVLASVHACGQVETSQIQMLPMTACVPSTPQVPEQFSGWMGALMQALQQNMPEVSINIYIICRAAVWGMCIQAILRAKAVIGSRPVGWVCHILLMCVAVCHVLFRSSNPPTSRTGPHLPGGSHASGCSTSCTACSLATVSADMSLR